MVQIVISGEIDADSFKLVTDWASIFSSLPLRTMQHIPADSCFRRIILRDLLYGFDLKKENGGTLAWYVDFALRQNSIDPAHSPGSPRLCIPQGKSSGVVLNLDKLSAFATSFNVQVSSKVLEDLPARKQIRWLRGCSVFMGLFGPHLADLIFLPPTAIFIQLLPYKIYNSGDHFKELATLMRMRQGQWANNHIHNAEIDFSAMRQDHELQVRLRKAEASLEALMKFGAKSRGDEDMQYIFKHLWGNQNTTVPLHDFRKMVQGTFSQFKSRSELSDLYSIVEINSTLVQAGSSSSQGKIETSQLLSQQLDTLAHLRFDLSSLQGQHLVDAQLYMVTEKVDPQGRNVGPDGKPRTITIFNDIYVGTDEDWTTETLAEIHPHKGPDWKRFGHWQIDSGWGVDMDVTDAVAQNLKQGKSTISFTIAGQARPSLLPTPGMQSGHGGCNHGAPAFS